MTRRSFTQPMPTDVSAARPAGRCFSCAFSSLHAFNFMTAILDTIIMVSIFVILGVLPGGLVSIPSILLICLAAVLCGSLISPKEQP